MAIRYAVASGNWSSTSTWNGGTLPTSSDDVYSNTFTITIDTSPTVLRISNAAATGVTAGGSFVPTNGITLTCTGAGVVSTSTVFNSTLTAGQSCSIVSNIAGPTTGATSAVTNAGAGTLNITGSVTGGSNNSGNPNMAVYNTSTGTINITGDVTGGSGSVTNKGVQNNSTGTISIVGSITGGSTAAGSGAENVSTGTLTHVGTAQATLAPAIAGGATGQVTVLSGPLLCYAPNDASAGVNPCIALRWFPADTALSTFRYEMRGQTASGSPAVRPTRNLYLTDAYAAGYPAAGNVRSGITYGAGGSLTGTCAVPPAASVGVGVPVDNTTGTAAITAATLRSSLGLASANLDTQLATAAADSSGTTTLLGRLTSGRATALDNLDATVSSRSTYAGGDTSGTTTLLGRLTTGRAAGLDNLDASVSSRLATSGYTAPPSAASIRTEIDTNSTKLDVAVSTRLAASSYTAAPTTSAIRTELSVELARIDAAISSRSTYAGGDTSGTTTLLGRLTSGRASGLDNLDATVSSRSTYSGADTSGTTTLLGRLTSTRASGLDNLDATISSRLATSGYTTPPTVGDIATAVWAAATRTLTTAIDNSATIAAAVWGYATGPREITGGTVDTLTNAPDVPSVAEISTGVRTELSTELARVANAATTQEVAEIVQDAIQQ